MKRRLAIGILSFACMGVTPAGPVVLVTAPVQASTFIDNLEEGRDKVQTDLAAALVALTKHHFPVLDWRTTATAPKAQLILALTERAASGPSKEVRLVWRARVGNTDKELPNLQPIPVYGTFDVIRETHDPVVLGTVLRTKVEEWFSASPNRASFSTAFVNLVPLAHSVAVDSTAQRIVLPFPMTDAKIGQRSRLVVRFVANDGGAPKPGSISVSDLLEESRASKLNTLAVVSAFEFASVPKVNGWSPRIEVLLRNPVQSNVFFDEYILSEAVVVNDVLVTP